MRNKIQGYRKSVWWENRGKWARNGQTWEEARTTSRWTPPGWKWYVQIALAQRRCDWREGRGILIRGKGSTGKQNPNKRRGVKSLWRSSCCQQQPSPHHQQEGWYALVLWGWGQHLWLRHWIWKKLPSTVGSKSWSSRAQAPSPPTQTWTAVSHWSSPRFWCHMDKAQSTLTPRGRLVRREVMCMVCFNPTSTPHGKLSSDSITSLCQAFLLLYKEVQAEPLLMLERTRRMGREGASPLMLVLLADTNTGEPWKPDHKESSHEFWSFHMQTKKTCVYAAQSSSYETRAEDSDRERTPVFSLCPVAPCSNQHSPLFCTFRGTLHLQTSRSSSLIRYFSLKVSTWSVSNTNLIW